LCRKLIFWVSFVLLLSLVGSAQAALVAHWRLDEGSGTIAHDASGNGHDGTFRGAPQWVAGKIGGALQLDGVDDEVLHSFPESEWSAGTVSFWVKATTLGQDNQSSAFAGYYPNTAGFQINVNGGNPGVYWTNPQNANVFGPVSLDWVHLALTWDGSSAKCYYDGSLATTGNLTATNRMFNQFRLGVNRNAINWFACTIDDFRVYDHALTQEEIQEAMKGAPPVLASKPIPDDKATDVPRDVTLSWTPGVFADKHDVYFGTNFNDVNDASRTNPLGILVSQGQDANTYDPVGVLDFGQTYYWRVDEVNAPPDFTIFKGDVWSFTVEPFAYPIAGTSITATASSQFNANQGPQNTINGSGLNADDLHSTEEAGIWLSSMTGAQPTWIQYEFDQVYKLYQMWVWNHNTSIEPILGFGVKDATIEYSVDGANWTALGTTHEFARAPGAAGYAHNTTIDLSGVVAKYVKITANSNWGGIMPQYGLSEVRFLYIPVLAREQTPASGSTDINVDNVTLSWRAGREAAKHNVYFSDSNQAVIDGTAPVTTVSQASYGPLSLDLGKTYYWRVDEVNEAETPTTWQGDVWNFSAQEYLVVDDFEDYNDFEPDRIFDTWIDGWGVPTNGSQVGYAVPPFAERTIIHGGKQSMPLNYDNSTASYSEATVNVANLQVGRDWTKYSIKTLSLYFYGDPNNAVTEKMYVKLNGSKVIYDGDADNITRIGWQPWNIELSSFGVNLRNVTELIIGLERIGAVGGSGVVYIDDVRLYPFSRELVTPAEPSQAGLVAHYEFEGTANDSSGNGLHGTLMGSPDFVAGKVGQAINLRGLSDYVEITGYKGILGPNAFSITAWIKTAYIGADPQEIVYYGTYSDGQRCEFRVHTNGHIRMGNGAGQVEGLTAVTDGGWHHVAATIIENATNSSSDVRIYVDGQDDTQESTDPDAFNLVADWDVTIGYRPSQNDRFFIGQIDDVRIYDRALTQEKIAWLAGRTKPFDKPF